MNAPQFDTSGAPRSPDAPDLALIHGWGIGRAAWNEPLPLLAEHFRVHRVSLPGYDGSVDANDAFDATAAALAQALPAGATLCGWSLGALLALRATQLAPRRFARLILCGATPCFTQREDWPHAQAPAVLDGFSAALADESGGVAATRQRFVALINRGDSRARLVTRAFSRALAEEPTGQAPGIATLGRGLDWLRRVDLRQLVTAHTDATPPSLIIHGAHDPLMPLPAAHWLAHALRGARLEVFPDAAHTPFASDARRFAQLLFDFCHA